ncbi:MAG: response regulator [Bacteroidota bacterium]
MTTRLNEYPSVLIVDDEKDLLLLMKFKLRIEGFKAEISLNGENIIDMLHTLQPDIILMDIHMEGIDGGTLCHLLKTNHSTSQIPIYMFSANDNINLITDQCGANGFIKKPFDIQKLKDTLWDILGNTPPLPLAV